MFFRPLIAKPQSPCLCRVGAPHEGGAPLAPFRYITDWEGPGRGWLLKGGGPFSLMTGRTLVAYDAERGVDEDVYLACPGTDPWASWGAGGRPCPPIGASTTWWRRRCRHRPQPVRYARAPRGRRGTPAGPPSDGCPSSNDGADDRKPPLASRIGGPTPQRCQGSGRTGRVGGHNGCRFLGQPSGGFWDAGGWRGCIPQYPGPTGSARRGVMGRPHGRQRCGSREGRKARRSCSLGQPAGCIWRRHCGVPGG